MTRKRFDHAPAQRHLSGCDPIMARLIGHHGDCQLGSKSSDRFHVLAVSIINQQLSTKAADTIQGRVETLLETPGVLDPARLAVADPLALRAAGLSGAKVRWLIDLAQRRQDGRLDLDAIAALDDEAAIIELDALPGIGRWTAEMLLIFAFGRPDVFSLGDAGLRRSINRLYNAGEKLDDDATTRIVEPWAPHRSVACWYLWRHADGNVDSWG